ncbi:MAG TPA: hypothetical protein VI072_29690 [Polyangiaceae bacterium]
MRTSAKRRLFWLVNAALVVACAKSGSLESEEGEDDVGGTSGRAGVSGFGGNSGSFSGSGFGGSSGVGGTSGTGGSSSGGAAGSSGNMGSGGTTAGSAGTTAGSAGTTAGSAGTGGSGGNAGSAGSGGSAGCSNTQTFCGDTCQPLSVSNGCGDPSCTPCSQPPANATAVCYEQGRRCSFDCNTGYARSSDGTSCVPTTCRAQDCQVTCLPFQWKCCQFTNKCGCGWTGFACFDPP